MAFRASTPAAESAGSDSSNGRCLCRSLIPIAWLVYVNVKTTGSPLLFGYDVANHGLHALGFGMRGSVVYKATGLPFENLKMFGPLEALACFAEAVHVALTQFWPTYLIFPLLYFSWRAGVKLPWGVGAVFGILPLGYCFYFYQADRFYLELLPFAMVGTAFLLDRLAQSSKLATLVMVGLLLATMLVGTVMKAIDRRQEYESRNSFAEAVERARTEHSRLLVFVRDRFPGPTEPFLEALYWYNIEDFPSNVIVARDLGEPNCMLTQRFPDHFAVLVSAVTKAQNDGLFVPEVRPLACFKS